MKIDSMRDIEAVDLSQDFARRVLESGVSAWDIETSGLDFMSDTIHTCQIYAPGVGTQIVKISTEVPSRLIDLMESDRVLKIFHHAPFDLRFMRKNWGVRARRIACTKVLSKILNPEKTKHSLALLVEAYLGVQLDKSQRLSDWSQAVLTADQIEYAAEDVRHLIDLYKAMWKEAVDKGVGDIAEDSFAYLPTRVETDLRGSGDVFSY